MDEGPTDARLDAVDNVIEPVGAFIDRIDKRIGPLGTFIDRIDTFIDRIDTFIDRIDKRIDFAHARMSAVDARIAPPLADERKTLRRTNSRNTRAHLADGLCMTATLPTAALLSRAALERLAEPLRLRLSPEEAPLLDLLVTLAASATSGGAAPEPSLADLVGAPSWEDVRITVVDGHTVRVGGRKRAVVRTYRDLGLHGGHSRMPTRKWELLVTICEGHGTFRWRDFGEIRAVSQAVSVLRSKLRGAFGIAGDPFYEWDGGWKARFFASSEEVSRAG